MKKYFFYILTALIGYGMGFYYSPEANNNSQEDETIAMLSNYDDSPATNNDFSEAALLSYMKKLKIKYPETVLSQARLETGNFKSAIFTENHNLFGMKLAETRPTFAIGINRGHAQYRNWRESVVDYALLQSYIIAKLPSVNKQEYRNYIRKFYSTTSDYLTRIDRTMKDGLLKRSEKDNLNNNTSIFNLAFN
jgi:uncharacterized FlgJ-related protein